MKNILASLTLLVIVLLSSMAVAAVYGPAGGKFTVTPAAGWTEKAMDGGVQLSNGKSALVIQVVASGGVALDAFSDAVIKQAGLTDVNKDKSNDLINVSAKKDGTDLQMIFSKVSDKFIAVFTLGGPDVDAMKEMIGSLKDAE